MRNCKFWILIFLIISLNFSFAQDFVGGMIESRGRGLALQCLQKNSEDQTLCDRAQFVLMRGKKSEVVGNSSLTPEEIKYFLNELSAMDEDDFTNNGVMKYLGQNYIGISLWCMMLGHQMESKAVQGVAGVSLVITSPLQVIKAPFVIIAKWFQKRKAEHRKQELKRLIDNYSQMRLIEKDDLFKAKVSKESFENILTWLDQSKLNPPIQNSKKLKEKEIQKDEDDFGVEVLAKYKANSKIYSSPAVTKDGTVIVGSHLGTVYIFSPDMKLISEYKTGHWIHGSPRILKSGVLDIPSYDGNLYFFNKQGEFINKAAPGGTIFSSTAELDDGTILIGSDDGFLYFLDNKVESSKVKRSFKTGEMIHCAPKVLPNGMIAVSSLDHNLYFIDKNANLKYIYKTGGGLVHSEPALLKDGTLVFGSYDKSVHFVDQEGKSKAIFTTLGWVHSTPAILHRGSDHEVVVIGSNDGHIYFLKPDGTLKAKFKTGAQVISSPVIINDETIAVGSYDHNLYFLDEEARLVGKFKTNGKIWSSPALMPDGKSIVVGSGDHYLYYLRLKQ